MVAAIPSNINPPDVIRGRYLQISHIPVVRDSRGRHFLDPAWLKDLLLHLDYILDFTLACPKVDGEAPSDFIEVRDSRIKFIHLPSRFKCSLRLPIMAYRLWKSVARADIVHSGVGGWLPISMGNLTALFSRMQRRFLVMIIESSPWRLTPGVRHSWMSRLKALLNERMNRWNIEQADMVIFTQPQYKNSLLTRNTERGHVIHASWIDDERILTQLVAEKDWEAKLRDASTPLRVIFAGRLVASKGVLPMLEAINLLEAVRCPVQIDVFGMGELIDTCERAARMPRQYARVSLLGVVPYGPEFFSLLRNYHAVIVPSISDEQPRIVYDAYSQAVPVLASDTAGLRDCVKDGAVGRLFEPGSAESIKLTLQWAQKNRETLCSMGLSALVFARRMTHRQMHFDRWILLDKSLKQLKQG